MRLIATSIVTACVLGAAPAVCGQGSKDHPSPRNVAIVLFPGVETLDFAGPVEVFASAYVADKRVFNTYTVAETREPVKSMGVVTLVPQYTLDDCPPPDVVVVPGGNVPEGGERLCAWLKARAPKTELTMSVCNGALLLSSAGLLDGLEATTHKSALQTLALMDPKVRVLTNRRYVDNGRVMTTAGVSAGIDGALHVVARMCGDEVAWQTARHMEYDWRPDEIEKVHAQPGRLVDGADALHFVTQTQKIGLDGAVAEYKKMDKPPSENEMNRWGYTLLRAKRVDEAIAMMRFVDAAFPASSNASDSLSEALEVKGDMDGAKKAAQQCLVRLEGETEMPAAQRQLIRNASSSRIARLSGTPASKFRFWCPACGGDCDTHGYLEGGKCPGCAMELVEKSG
jgi:putative intracellular protease/amidase